MHKKYFTDFRENLWNPERLFWLLCCIQVLFWTLGPWLVKTNLHYDTMESIAWGGLWQLGYDKHPPFSAWIAELMNISPGFHLPIYFFSQVNMVITFLAIWTLAKEYLDSNGALLSVFLLVGILFYSQRVEYVNPDTLQHPVWSLLVLAVYYSVHRQNWKYWIAAGVLSGVSLLTKYQGILILIGLSASLLCSERGRSCLKTAKPWVSLLLGFLVFLPHLLWLIKNDFACIQYFSDQYSADSIPIQSFISLDNIIYPGKFIINSLGSIAPFLLLIWPMYGCMKLRYKLSDLSFNHVFLLSVCFTPFLLSVLFGIFTGRMILSRWATPYFACLPLTVIVFLCPNINKHILKKVIISCLILFLLLWSLRILYYRYHISSHNSINYNNHPLKEEMSQAEELWASFSDTKLPYIAGTHYHVVGMAAYKKNKQTIPFSGLNASKSPWINKEDFYDKGGIIVINLAVSERKEMHEIMKKKYSKAKFIGRFSFNLNNPNGAKHPTESVSDYYLLTPKQK